MFFDDALKTIDYITIKLPRFSYKDINVIDETQVELNPMFFSWDSINMKGIPENASFGIRFLSDEPVVISHNDHTPSYHG